MNEKKTGWAIVVFMFLLLGTSFFWIYSWINLRWRNAEASINTLAYDKAETENDPELSGELISPAEAVGYW